jgi:hypothetical protein
VEYEEVNLCILKPFYLFYHHITRTLFGCNPAEKGICKVFKEESGQTKEEGKGPIFPPRKKEIRKEECIKG